MKLKLIALLLLTLAVAAVGAAGYAMPVRYEGGSLVATATNVADGTEYALDAAEFQLIGRDEDGSYLIFADQQYLKVSREDMAEVSASLGLAAVTTLPRTANYETLARNSKGDAVRALQQALIDLGYIKGTADGDFGGQSQRAVNAVQKDMGLEQTGEADALLQMLIFSMAQEERVVVSMAQAASKYDPISGKTEAKLEAVIASGQEFEYDDIDGVGTISDGSVIEYSVPYTADIDQHDFTVRFLLYVQQQDDGEVTIDPAVLIDCLCVRRPMMKEITLKSGDERYTLPVEKLSNALSGVKSVESAVVLLNDDVAAMLQNASGEGELKLRINGKYDTFDVAIPAESLPSISETGRLALSLDQ